MPNRREFVQAVAGVAAGVLTPRALVFGQAPGATRRQISIAGRRVPVVDVHAHCGVATVAAVVKGTAFQSNGNVAGAQVLNPARIATMDGQGVDYQALSINGFWWYAVTDRDLADRIVRSKAAIALATPSRVTSVPNTSLNCRR